MKTDPFDNSPPKTPLKGDAPAAAKTPALSGEDARQLVEHLAVVTKSGMPIAPALRAAAAELPHQRVAAAMSRLAGELEMGRSLDSILRNNPRFLPPHMQRLIETGVQSGNLPQVLVQLLEIDRSAIDLRRSVRLAIAYPVMLLLLWTILVALFAGYVLPGLLRIFEEFKTNLPLPTKMLTWISGKGALRVVGFLAAAIPMVIVSFRIFRRPFAWQRLVIDIPLFGPTLLWRGVANWSRLLALLLRQQIPLPEAVRLAANGTSAPVITIGALRAARSIEAGRKLADGLALVRMVPASLVPLVRWGEEHGALPESLDAAAEMFERRVHLRATFLQSVLPPLAFIFIATGTLWLTNAMILPLVSLIRDLSRGWGPRGPITTSDLEHDAVVFAGVVIGVWLAMTMMIWLYRSAVGTFFAELASHSNHQTGAFSAAFFALFRFLYWAVSLFLLLVIMAGLGGPLGFCLWIATIIIIIMVKARYREIEQHSLMWLLAVATEKGIPLPAAIRALSTERTDKLGRRMRYLADAVEQGMPLEAALRAAWIRLPTDALLAVRSGSNTGGLATLMKSTVRNSTNLDAAKHAAIGRVVYLTVFLSFATVVISFIVIRIVPSFVKIFSDFKMSLPPVTQAFIQSAYGIAPFSAVATIGFFGLLLAMLYALARYTGLLRWEAPLIRRFAIALDEAVILRSMAQSVEQGTTITSAMAWLAKRYPKEFIRERLWNAIRHIDGGVHWCDSLQASKLLPAAEAGVLKAAERVGNLVWALNDTADRLSRRFTNRLTGLLSIGFPLVLLALAAVVFFVAVGLIFPLAKLITDLAITK